MKMLLKTIYHKLPYPLYEFIKPLVTLLNKAISHRQYLQSHPLHKHNSNINIPVIINSRKKESGIYKYHHRLKYPPKTSQFQNVYSPNDYSEIENKAVKWNQEPILKASVIVASYNQSASLKLNLLAWNHQTYPLNLIEVIVTDDGSGDGTEELVENLQKEVNYSLKFITQEDKGFRLAKARNNGVNICSGDVVLFVDADTIPSPEYIAEHLKYYHVADNVAVIGKRHRISPKVSAETVIHHIQALRKRPMLKDKGVSNKVRHWRSKVLFNNTAFRKQWNPWGGFHGSLCSCRKEDYLAIGGSDESFIGYGQEDIELAYRLLAKIQYLVSNPKARIYHLEHPENPNVITKPNAKLFQKKTKGPKVTVYMPTYNNAVFIEEAIASVFAQTLQDFELIIVNDGSTDKTSEILKKYCNNPKVRIFSQEHKGIGAASNLAMCHARGEYICQCDSDDILLPKALQILAKELDKNPNIGFVYAGRFDLHKDGQEIQRNVVPYDPGSFLLFMEASHPRMWRRSCFYKTEGFIEQIINSVDYDIALKLEDVCHVKAVEAILYKYRWHNTNTSIVHLSEQKHNSVLVLNHALKRRGLPIKATGYDKGAIFKVNRYKLNLFGKNKLFKP